MVIRRAQWRTQASKYQQSGKIAPAACEKKFMLGLAIGLETFSTTGSVVAILSFPP